MASYFRQIHINFSKTFLPVNQEPRLTTSDVQQNKRLNPQFFQRSYILIIILIYYAAKLHTYFQIRF